MTAPWPALADEPERLVVLHGLSLLDTPSDERFDRITRLASLILSVPIALVSLTDADRQWFKSKIGLVQDELPREETFCGYAVATEHRGLLVVEDASVDTRFAHLPAVWGDAPIRAYAGQVLRVRDMGVGTLCVMDHRPRQFDEAQLAALADLAHWAEAELRSDDERRMAREVNALQRRTEMVLAGVAEGVVGVDRDGAVAFTNTAGRSMLGWPGHGMLGENLHAIAHSRHADGSPYPTEECPVTEVLATGTSQRHLSGTFWRRDGNPVPVDWSVGAVLEEGSVVGAVVVFDDVSRRLEVERMEEDFTAIVSHELRTPLTSLKGALKLLDGGVGGEIPDAVKPLLDIAVRNAQRLAQLVDDILDVERSAKGQLQLHRHPVQVAQLMQTAAETVQGTAATQQIHLEVTSTGGVVWGDEHRLIQVLTNLLGNAMRFSTAGSRVWLRSTRDDESVRISVTDEGVGIPQSALDRVFDRFWQVDASVRRTRGGTGLGLAIAKNIALAHGGDISVESEEGRGSTFTVCLPLRSRSTTVAVERRHNRATEHGEGT